MKLLAGVCLLIVLPALGLPGCTTNSSIPNTTGQSVVGAVQGPDYRNRGKVSYGVEEGRLTSSTGCEITFTQFRPRGVSIDVLVILAHGFMRNKARMKELARHLAGWGISVVTVEFCNSKLWAGNHDLNGADMVAVAQKLGARKVIYTAFSAGALAAMVAAGLDENTLGFLGLDMVDHRGLGKKTASETAIPLYGLVAAPSVCNAKNNGLEAYATRPNSNLIRIEDASHCHFEFPMDRKCLLMCGKGEQYSHEEIQQTILGLTTAFFLWQTGVDPDGETWWSENMQNYKILMEAGYIKMLANDEIGFLNY